MGTRADNSVFEEDVILEDLSRDDLMDTILSFLQSIFNYNSVADKNNRVNVLDTFEPYANVEVHGIDKHGIDLSSLETKQLEHLLLGTYFSYSIAVAKLKQSPTLPLIVDDNLFIQIIEHTA